MLDDDLIKKSKCEIPELNDSLMESIEAKAKIQKKKRHKLNLKVFIPVLSSCFLVVLILSLSIGISLSNKTSKKSNGTDYKDDRDMGLIDEYSAFDGKKVTSITGESSIEGYTLDKSVSDEEVVVIEDNSKKIKSGTLTSSAYDDNEYYEFYQSLLSTGQTEEENGIFSKYFNDFKLLGRYRYKVTLNKDMSAALFLLDENDEIIYSTFSNRNGINYLYYNNDSINYKVLVKYIDKTGYIKELKEDISSDKDYTNLLDYKNDYKDKIEIMFVIDTTGSMGDEIRYIQVEVEDIISKIKAQNPNAEIRLAMLVYRDKEDAYVTKYSDFTTDIEAQKNFILNESANGGGDFEEAVDKAFSEALNRDWSNDFSTKIIVHIADAPAHDNVILNLFENVKVMSSKGIKIIPVASSGIDKKTEYFMREEALLTQSIYTYLTNDSGVGGYHIDATTMETPEIELLNSMLVRLINGFHKGEFEDPINYKQDPALNINN